MSVATTPTRYFVDPSIGPGALREGSEDLLRDLNAAGYHFEALVVRDLRSYAQALGGTVETWRDESGNEVDAILVLPNGRWGRPRRSSSSPRPAAPGSATTESTSCRSPRSRPETGAAAEAAPARPDH